MPSIKVFVLNQNEHVLADKKRYMLFQAFKKYFGMNLSKKKNAYLVLSCSFKNNIHFICIKF